MKPQRRCYISLLVVLGIVLIALFPFIRHQEKKKELEYELLTILGDAYKNVDKTQGRWSVPGMGKPRKRLNEEEIKRLAKLTTLPYLQGYRNAPAKKNVTVYDSSLACAGVNLYTSGHAPEAFAIDMGGKVLHKWRYEIKDIWPGVPSTEYSTFWRRAHWYPNGDILAIFEGIGIIKLDKDSNLLWAYRGGCHHQAYVTEDGEIYVLTRQADIIPRINAKQPVLLDEITVLNPEGKVLRRVPLLECFEDSNYKGLLRWMRKQADTFHTNSVYVFDGAMSSISPYFAKGNVLVSILKLDAIAIIDLNQRRIVWAESGRSNRLWKTQHDATLLPDGDILLFDNCGNNEKSRALEYDIMKHQVIWQYAGEFDKPLYSRTCGTAQRLWNGNTLIAESDNGRALEVTHDKKVVWEFYNPHRAGEHKELIATLFEIRRVKREFMQWLTTEQR